MESSDDGPSWTLSLKGGERIVVPANIRNFSSYVFLEQEDWFEAEAGFVRKLVKPGVRCLDIGANLGFYTLLMAKAAGPSGHVWAFEPTPITAGRLRESLSVNGLANATIFEMAVGAENGQAVLKTSASSEFNALTALSAPSEKQRSVAIGRLDDIAREHGIRDVAFVKLDVEGAEIAVLDGAAAFLERDMPLIMVELWHGATPQPEILDAFRGRGWQLFRLAPGLGRLVPLPGDEYDMGSLNIFAASPARTRLLAEAGFLIPQTAAPPAPGEAFTAFAVTFPLGRHLSARLPPETWRQNPSLDVYLRALDHYAVSRDSTAALAQRHGHLQESFRTLRALCRKKGTAARLISLARISRDLGLEFAAGNAIQHLVDLMRQGAPLQLNEPFLALNPRFEQMEPPVEPDAWIMAMVLEFYCCARYPTTYGRAAEFLSALEHIAQLGYGTAELERRRQLCRLFDGQQRAPDISPVLACDRHATLNWAYWAGDLAAR